MVTDKGIFGSGINFRTRFIKDHDELFRKVQNLRDLGYIIAMTQGSYDITHIGHDRFLEKGKSKGVELAERLEKEGCILLVAVDSDHGVNLRKSKPKQRRPMIPEIERCESIAGKKPVDLVTIDTDCHPEGHASQGHSKFSIVHMLRPELYFASQDSYSAEQINFLENLCGEVFQLEPQANQSTSAILRIATLEKQEEYEEKMGRMREKATGWIRGTINNLSELVKTVEDERYEE